MKTTVGILYSLNGLSMLIVWPILILNDQAPEINTNFSYMCFHLVSEFIAASMCLIVGIGLLRKRNRANKYYFLASGFFLGAGYLAIGFYIFSDLPSALEMIIMLGSINLIGLVLFIIILTKGMLINLSKYLKLLYLFSGVTIYTLINIAGFLSEMNSGYTFGYMSMVLILIIFIIWNTIKNLKTAYSTSLNN